MTLDEAVSAIEQLVDFRHTLVGQIAWQTLKSKVLDQQTNNSQSKLAEQICSQCSILAICAVRKSASNLKGCILVHV